MGRRVYTQQLHHKPPIPLKLRIDPVRLIHSFKHIDKISQLKIKIQDQIPVFKLPALLHKRLQLPKQRQQGRGQVIHALMDHIIFTLPLHLQKLLIAPLQKLSHPVRPAFEHPLCQQHVLLKKSRAVHLSSPGHQIVGLVHQKQILPLHTLGKIPPQPGIGVKYIIIITDDPVHPVGNVKTKLKRTHLIPAGIGNHLVPGDPKLPVDDVIHRVIYPVKMPLSVRAAIRVTLR